MDIATFLLRKSRIGIIILRTLIQHRIAELKDKENDKLKQGLTAIDSLLDLIDDF